MRNYYRKALQTKNKLTTKIKKRVRIFVTGQKCQIDTFQAAAEARRQEQQKKEVLDKQKQEEAKKAAREKAEERRKQLQEFKAEQMKKKPKGDDVFQGVGGTHLPVAEDPDVSTHLAIYNAEISQKFVVHTREGVAKPVVKPPVEVTYRLEDEEEPEEQKELSDDEHDDLS